jgi:hypothetical protein
LPGLGTGSLPLVILVPLLLVAAEAFMADEQVSAGRLVLKRTVEAPITEAPFGGATSARATRQRARNVHPFLIRTM